MPIKSRSIPNFPGLLATYGAAIFLGSTLLFVVQPLLGRLLLPTYGGAPAVWNTTMFFCQAALLAGYAYADALARRWRPRTQVVIHLTIAAAGLLLLPLSLSGVAPDPESNPVPGLLARLSLAILIPFGVLAAGSPLLQRWFSQTPHHSAADPYFLYAVSNLGSLGGLLAYPLLIEPLLRLPAQQAGWSIGYAIYFVLLAVACVHYLRSRPADPVAAGPEPREPPPRPTWRRRVYWIILGFIPSSLLLGVTSYLTTDVASFPLLWVLPLSLYLTTFILAFARKTRLPRATIRTRGAALAITTLGFLIAGRLTDPFWLVGTVHLLAFFIVATAAHGALADDRPDPYHLTGFYLLLSVGGVLGGAFNSLIGPLVFNGFHEYPITLALAALVLLPGAWNPRVHWKQPAAALLLILVLLLSLRVSSEPAGTPEGMRTLIFGAVAIALYLFSRNRIAFAGAWSLLLLVAAHDASRDERTLLAVRGFFGQHRVIEHPREGRVELVHGRTAHGSQFIDPRLRYLPLAYYHPAGPSADIMMGYRERADARIGVVGLGAGALAAYGRPGQHWTFFEIDPLVVMIARDDRYFTYLKDTKADWDIILGDARLTLTTVPDGTFDLLILDAYSSDAVPVHLFTVEAIKSYVDKLRPGGLLAFHLSNRHLDLETVAGALFESATLAALYRDDTHVTDTEQAVGKSPSQWAIAARSATVLAPFAANPAWRPLQPRPGAPVWTDDRASFIPVLRWRLD